MKDSYENKAGDLVLICDSLESRNSLKAMVENSSAHINTKMLSPRNSISIVGFDRAYTNEELVQQMIDQNALVKDFIGADDISLHIKVRAVKPLKKNGEKYQAFCFVSNELKTLFTNNNNKLMFGLNSCKVYDQYNVKRCFNCQNFGHYAQNCPTPTKKCCAKCALDHPTVECASVDLKCANCLQNKLSNDNHAASDTECPIFLKTLNGIKSSLNLN